jgi:hypothetical protein
MSRMSHPAWVCLMGFVWVMARKTAAAPVAAMQHLHTALDESCSTVRLMSVCFGVRLVGFCLFPALTAAHVSHIWCTCAPVCQVLARPHSWMCWPAARLRDEWRDRFG